MAILRTTYNPNQGTYHLTQSHAPPSGPYIPIDPLQNSFKEPFKKPFYVSKAHEPGIGNTRNLGLDSNL